MIDILVVDDHAILREGIVAAIERHADLRVVGEASDGGEAVALFDALRPDVTIMDLQMRILDGIGAIEGIRSAHPDAVVLVLTTYSSNMQVDRALRAGAVGYLLKNDIRKDLADAIRSVHAGKLVRPILGQGATTHRLLSDRELEILSLAATGLQNKQIAWNLGISTDTVKGHLKQIFAKLGVVDRTQAVVAAARAGLLAF